MVDLRINWAGAYSPDGRRPPSAAAGRRQRARQRGQTHDDHFPAGLPQWRFADDCRRADAAAPIVGARPPPSALPYYPPALTGLRGSHDGSFEAAHKLRDGEKISIDGLKAAERYDLVVVGGGISGLAAAWFYRKRFGARAKILILDNHDDFGGHARRNEFSVDGRTVLGYGGSESFQSPSHDFSDVVNGLLKDLKVDYRRFEKYFDRGLYPGHRMSRGVFFNREDFKVDKLVTGDPTRMVADDIPADRMNARPPHLFIRDMPISDTRSRASSPFMRTRRMSSPARPSTRRQAYLEKISYRDYLKKHWGLDDEAANVFQRRSHDFFALGIDAIPASFAQETGYPGFKGLATAGRRGGRGGVRGTLHLPFPRRQRLGCPLAGAGDGAGCRRRQDDGGYRHLEVRLRQARPPKEPGSHPPRRHRAGGQGAAETASRSATGRPTS